MNCSPEEYKKVVKLQELLLEAQKLANELPTLEKEAITISNPYLNYTIMKAKHRVEEYLEDITEPF